MKNKTLIFTMMMALASSSYVSGANKPNEQEKFSGYLFAYFEGGGDPNQQEHLRFAVSEDAQNWYALNGNRLVISSDSIS